MLTQNVISKDEEIGIKRKQNQNKNKHLQFQTKLNENNKNETNNLKNIQLVSAPRPNTQEQRINKRLNLCLTSHGNTIRIQLQLKRQFDIAMTPQDMSQTYPSTHFESGDKGGDVEIMNTDDYANEANSELSDKGNYTLSPNELTLQHNEMANNTTERFQKENLLSKKTAEHLKIFSPKTSKFFITPKIHKENNPGRPVINSINCHTSEITRFEDRISDTTDFFKKINN